MSKQSGIYCWRNEVNGKVYIGSSVHVMQRKQTHVFALRKNIHGNPHLQSAWNKYGEDSFSFRILELTPKEMLPEREAYYFEIMGAMDRTKGYNLRPDPTRHVLTDEIRQKISQAKKGTKLSAKQKKQISEFHKGKKRSQQTKDNISKSLTGRNFSETHKINISKAKKGKKTCGDECRRKKSALMQERWQKQKAAGNIGFGLKPIS